MAIARPFTATIIHSARGLTPAACADTVAAAIGEMEVGCNSPADAPPQWVAFGQGATAPGLARSGKAAEREITLSRRTHPSHLRVCPRAQGRNGPAAPFTDPGGTHRPVSCAGTVLV